MGQLGVLKSVRDAFEDDSLRVYIFGGTYSERELYAATRTYKSELKSRSVASAPVTL